MSGDLLGLIYDSALDPAQWPAALTAIMAAVGGQVSALLHWDSRTSPVGSEVMAVSGYSEASVKIYEDYFGVIDVRRTAVTALAPGAIYIDDRHIAFADVQKSEIFQDFHRPLGIGHCIAAKLFDDPTRISVVGIHRPLGERAFGPTDVALLETLVPHLARALQLQRQVANARHMARGAVVGLDHFPIAVFIVNAEATVVEMNRAAAEMLRQPDCQLRREGGRLHAASPPATHRLHDAIHTMTDALGRRPPNPILRLQYADGRRGMAIMVAPARRNAAIDGNTIERIATPLALIFAADPRTPAALAGDILRHDFGLSAAEAGVAVSLVMGSSLEEIAAHRMVSKETVRAQLKRALAKTETHSQAQFVAVIARSLAMLRRP